MRALALCLLLAAPAAAQTAPAPFSIAKAGLTVDDVAAILEQGRGRYVVVGDFIVDVASSSAAGADAPLSRPEGEALARAALTARLARLRSAADEGRLGEQDRAQARALAAARSGLLAGNELYFLDSLNPDANALAKGQAYVPAAAAPDMLAAGLRSRLVLDDHGSPAQAEALDMAVRLMLQSPTARALSAEFVKLDRRVKVSFETLDGSLLGGDEKHRYVTGVGGLTSHLEGDWVQLNRTYLETSPRYQFENLPGILAHELLGHAYNDARARNAGVTAAMNRWRGDEETAGVTGWLVECEINGKLSNDAHLSRYLADPERYRRALHLVTAYYAQGVSPDEAGRLDAVYAERLARVSDRIADIQKQLADRTDWGAILDHFEKIHGTDPWRLRGLRDDLLHPSTAAVSVELGRLLDIRLALTQDLANLKDPARRAELADLAKLLSDPFFADSEKRLAVLSDRLRAFAAAHAPAAEAAAVPPVPGITVTVVKTVDWDELRRMYEDDKRDHPEHWAPPPAQTPTEKP